MNIAITCAQDTSWEHSCLNTTGSLAQTIKGYGYQCDGGICILAEGDHCTCVQYVLQHKVSSMHCKLWSPTCEGVTLKDCTATIHKHLQNTYMGIAVGSLIESIANIAMDSQ